MTSIIERIALDLCLDAEYIKKIINRSNYYYKDYIIPKSNGGIREISHPSPELKTLQYWASHNILSYLPISEATFAYKKGDSIKKHAMYHSNANFIFHTDIKKFFPNIHSNMLTTQLLAIRPKLEQESIWYDDVCDILSKICFRKDLLCIGAVSSPIISNAILFLFDEKMREYCKKHKLRYSRYADDIYVSSVSYLDVQVSTIISKELLSFGFETNPKKTWFSSKKFRQRVTGLIITTDGKISVGTDTRKRIKKMIYERIMHGRGDPDVVLGYLSYLKDIEPTTYNHLIVKYSGYCNGDIINAIKNGVPQE